MSKIKKIFFVIFILILGGLGGIIGNRYFFPYISTTSLFSKYEFLKKSAEDVTIINKTEQIYVKEETSIEKISSKVASSVVDVLSYTEASVKNKNIAAVFNNTTGTIVTSDGLIMTYMENVIPNSKYKVVLQGGGVHEAELSGVDSYSNLVFLKINNNNLPVISLGNSDDSTPGEKIIAIGSSSKTFTNRYTSGLISTFDPTFSLSGKAISYSDKMNGVFQTDFNSDSQQYYTGGPVVDYTGQVIGIAGSNQKDFFFIPSNKVKKVVDKAVKKELETSVSLGVYYIPLTKAYVLSSNLNQESGALIFSASGQEGLAIISGSNGQRAGLKIDDTITAVNGEKVSLQNDLSDLLYKYKKGDKIELTIQRDSQETKVAVQF